MKNKTTARIAHLIGIIALVAVIGITFAACDNGSGTSRPNPSPSPSPSPDPGGGDEEFTVTFNLDGGNIDGVTASVEITVKSGEKIANLPDPKKADNTFGGWFAEKNGSGNEFVSTTTVTSNLTVFAKWIPDPVPQTKTLENVPSIGGFVNVNINYTAVGTPSYVNKLVNAVNYVAQDLFITSGTLTINVIATGADGFTKGSSQTLNVRESWISSTPQAQVNTAIELRAVTWVE